VNALANISMERPETVEAAARALAAPGAQALAGGTDLLPNLRRGLGEPELLVDLSRVADFDACEIGADGRARIGAGMTLAAIADDARIRANWAALATAAGLVAGPTHRLSATLGGNLCQDTRCVFYNQSDWWRSGNGYCLKYRGEVCHVVVKSDRCYATYHGDVAPALMVLGAEAEIVGPAGTRRIPIAELFVEDGARRLTLAPGELLVAVHLPPAGNWHAGYEKARVRDAVDFPLAGVAVALQREGDRIAGLRVAITGTNSAPLAVPTESFVGQSWSPELAAALGEAVRKTSNVLQTTTLAVKYRRRVLVKLTGRLAATLWDGATADT
jgi:4-hydroxybenzoyl-CoA reductase subunit beta